MLTSNALISSVSSSANFLNLAIFICQLFIDGKFRSGNILYEPVAFDDRFLSELESICPYSIPWQLIDVTKPFQSSKDDPFSTALQLNFFDLKRLVENEFRYFTPVAHYQICISTSISGIDTKLISAIKNSPLAFVFITLIVEYNTEIGLINIHWTKDVGDVTKKSEERFVVEPNAIDIWGGKTNAAHDNLFERTLGMYEKRRPIVFNIDGLRTKIYKETAFDLNPRLGYFVNYHYFALYPSLIRVTFMKSNNQEIDSDEIWIPKLYKYYRELFGNVDRLIVTDKS